MRKIFNKTGAARHIPAALVLSALLSCGSGEKGGPAITGGENGDCSSTDGTLPGRIDVTVPESSPEAVAYNDLYDSSPDAGRFSMPEMPVRPVMHWTCVDIADRSDRNSL